MSGNIHLGGLLAVGLCTGPIATAFAADQAFAGDGCGQAVRARDVMVIDVEPLRRDLKAARQFVDERAGAFRLLDADIEEIRTRTPPSRDPDGLVRSARKLGSQRGCDLVLVLKTGPYFGRQRSPKARMKDRGYALVVIGQRTDDQH